MKKILILFITLYSMIVCDKSPTDVDHVDSIELTPVELKIATGDTATFSATLRNKAGDIIDDRPVSWRSQDTTIIVVTDGGKISAKKEGQTIIRAECAGVSAEATVHVFDFLGQALLENQSNHEAIKISWQSTKYENINGYIPTDQFGYFILPSLYNGGWIVRAEYPYYKGLADTIIVENGKPARPLKKFTLLQQLKFEVTLAKQYYSVNDTIWIEFKATNLTDEPLIVLSDNLPILARAYAIVDNDEPIMISQGHVFDYTIYLSGGSASFDGREFAPGETKIEKSLMTYGVYSMFIDLQPLYKYGAIDIGKTYQIFCGYPADYTYPWEYFANPSYSNYSNPYFKLFNYSLYKKLEPAFITITE